MKRSVAGFAVLLIVFLTCSGILMAQSGGATQGSSTKGLVVNINTANQAELERLPGIGPSLAKKILDFRQKNGNFKATSDLMAVQGIGEKKYEQLKTMIAVK